MASLDLENSEVKGAKLRHHLSNQIHTQCAMIDKTKQTKNPDSHSERGRMRDFLQALAHSNSKIPIGRYYEAPFPGGMECSLFMP